MPNKLQMHIVENWVSMTDGAFQISDAARELGVITPEGRDALRVYLSRMVIAGAIERTSGKDGIFRRVDKTINEINFIDVDLTKTVQVKLPFQIHEYITFYVKNTILIAGESNAGKTCFLFNIAAMNYEKFDVDFFTNNEASPQEIAKRLKALDLPIPPPFKVYERYDNFADVVDPNHLTIIDYLDMNSEVYLAGEEIEKIHRKLNQGIAIIGMQLPPPSKTYERGVEKIHHRSLAYGGAFTQKKPVLYIDLWRDGAPNTGICKIEKAKNRAKPNVDPNNMQWKYVIDSWGAKFLSYERNYGTGMDG